MAARGFQPQLVAAAVALSDLGVVGHLVPVRSLQESIEKLHAHCVKAPPSRVAYKECAQLLLAAQTWGCATPRVVDLVAQMALMQGAARVGAPRDHYTVLQVAAKTHVTHRNAFAGVSHVQVVQNGYKDTQRGDRNIHQRYQNMQQGNRSGVVDPQQKEFGRGNIYPQASVQRNPEMPPRQGQAEQKAGVQPMKGKYPAAEELLRIALGSCRAALQQQVKELRVSGDTNRVPYVRSADVAMLREQQHVERQQQCMQHVFAEQPQEPTMLYHSMQPQQQAISDAKTTARAAPAMPPQFDSPGVRSNPSQDFQREGSLPWNSVSDVTCKAAPRQSLTPPSDISVPDQTTNSTSPASVFVSRVSDRREADVDCDDGWHVTQSRHVFSPWEIGSVAWAASRLAVLDPELWHPCVGALCQLSHSGNDAKHAMRATSILLWGYPRCVTSAWQLSGNDRPPRANGVERGKEMAGRRGAADREFVANRVSEAADADVVGSTENRGAVPQQDVGTQQRALELLAQSAESWVQYGTAQDCALALHGLAKARGVGLSPMRVDSFGGACIARLASGQVPVNAQDAGVAMWAAAALQLKGNSVQAAQLGWELVKDGNGAGLHELGSGIQGLTWLQHVPEDLFRALLSRCEVEVHRAGKFLGGELARCREAGLGRTVTTVAREVGKQNQRQASKYEAAGKLHSDGGKGLGVERGGQDVDIIKLSSAAIREGVGIALSCGTARQISPQNIAHVAPFLDALSLLVTYGALWDGSHATRVGLSPRRAAQHSPTRVQNQRENVQANGGAYVAVQGSSICETQSHWGSVPNSATSPSQSAQQQQRSQEGIQHKGRGSASHAGSESTPPGQQQQKQRTQASPVPPSSSLSQLASPPMAIASTATLCLTAPHIVSFLSASGKTLHRNEASWQLLLNRLIDTDPHTWGVAPDQALGRILVAAAHLRVDSCGPQLRTLLARAAVGGWHASGCETLTQVVWGGVLSGLVEDVMSSGAVAQLRKDAAAARNLHGRLRNQIHQADSYARLVYGQSLGLSAVYGGVAAKAAASGRSRLVSLQHKDVLRRLTTALERFGVHVGREVHVEVDQHVVGTPLYIDIAVTWLETHEGTAVNSTECIASDARLGTSRPHCSRVSSFALEDSQSAASSSPSSLSFSPSPSTSSSLRAPQPLAIEVHGPQHYIVHARGSHHEAVLAGGEEARGKYSTVGVREHGYEAAVRIVPSETIRPQLAGLKYDTLYLDGDALGVPPMSKAQLQDSLGQHVSGQNDFSTLGRDVPSLTTSKKHIDGKSHAVASLVEGTTAAKAKLLQQSGWVVAEVNVQSWVGMMTNAKQDAINGIVQAWLGGQQCQP